MDKYTVQHWNGEKWCNDRLKLDYDQAKKYALEHKNGQKSIGDRHRTGLFAEQMDIAKKSKMPLIP